ncbi:MAG: hypothetical protein H6Q03_2970 [Acidobacteria bacterium]|nr:hypothetical protein [Acidobacteriota bacterium]
MWRALVPMVALSVLSWAGPLAAGEKSEAPTAPTAPAVEGPLAALAPLAGSCFLGTFADGKTRDFICYEWMWGGKFLRSRHRVIGGAGPYAGETVISYDAASGKLAFDYYNSAGGIVRGQFEVTADGFDFPAEKVQMQGAPAELRSTWRWTEGGYRAVSEKRVGDAWSPFMAIDFVRSGPASDWTEAE